jgi:hypothetical protein
MSHIHIFAYAMAKASPLISLMNFTVFVDEQCALHIGACCNNSILNTHSPQNLQGCPAYIDLIASCL